MSGELQNIPPLWTAVFHWLAYLLYASLLPRRGTARRRALIAALLLAVQLPYMRMIAPLSDAAFNLGMTGFALLTFLPFPLLCRSGRNNYIYYCARAFILGGFTVSLAWQFYSYYSLRAKWLGSSAAEAAFMLLVGAAVFAAIYALERTHLREIREMSIHSWSGLSAAFMALVIYILSSLSYSSLETPFTTTSEADIFNIRTIVYFGGVAILYAYHLQICNTHALREISVLQNVLDMQYANYQQSQASIDMVNRKYHDLKHQIAVLRAEIGALFGNALDNAIEGVGRLADPEQRLIHLSVTRQKDFLRVKVENRCVDGLVVGEELPKTTKEDKGLHGYGLKSIRATAEKYGGSVTIRAENGWFTLGVLIPRPAPAMPQTAE